jgi:hypothetical protein
MLDLAEVDRGKLKGKPREKFTRIDEMLAVSFDGGIAAGGSLASPLEITSGTMARS